jgi:hypothetical protein
MVNLTDILLAPARKDALVSECVLLIEQHVAGRGGFKGMGLKTAVGLLKAARPDILPSAMRRLLPDFAAALEPHYQACLRESRDFCAELLSREDETCSALLYVADQRVAASQNAAAKKVYARLRGSAEDEVKSILPKLAPLIARYAEN